MRGSMIFIAGSECFSGPAWKEYCCKTVPAPAAQMRTYKGQETSSSLMPDSLKISTTALDNTATNPYKIPQTTPNNSARWERMRRAIKHNRPMAARPRAKDGTHSHNAGEAIHPRE